MSRKNKPKRSKKNQEAFPGSAPASRPSTSPNDPVVNPSRRWFLVGTFLLITVGGTYLARGFQNANVDVERFGYKRIETHPHDSAAFTQGLVLQRGVVYESTGKYDGQSSVRKVDLATGKILKKVPLADDQFGEGLAMVGDELYQLTWKKGICHVYDKELNKIREYQYDGQGWGLAYDGTHLIMSDGTSRLYFLDPETFKEVRTINVRSGMASINSLNELEFTGGMIYANRWQYDSIYEIDPKTGKVNGIIDLQGIWPHDQRPAEGVLNGIAVDEKGKIIVTGKYCPSVFEIELVRKN